MFTFHGNYCDYSNCDFTVNRYRNTKNICLSIVSQDEGPICHCTAGIDKKLPDDRIAVKDYSENEGMTEKLKDMDIITGEAVDLILSGLVVIEIYMLTEKGKKIIKDSLGG